MSDPLFPLRVLAFVVGVWCEQAVIRSAIRTVVVPQGEQTRLTRKTFLATRPCYDFFARRKKTMDGHARVMARYAPTTLLVLAATWVTVTVGSFVLLFWSFGNHTLLESFRLSGSSITTLGILDPTGTGEAVLAFTEAILGLAIVALVISFLPTIYSLFSQREAEVVKLDVRAGSPPTALEMLKRFHDIDWIDRLGETWETWEVWFATLEESHSTHPALVFFRSQRTYSSWITAAGALLDTAAIAVSSLEHQQGPQANVTIRAGFMALQRIAGFYGVPVDEHPAPNDPISIYKEEFLLLLDELAAHGLAVRADREQAWRDYAGWRVNYDLPLLALCALCDAPPTPWSSDRIQHIHHPTLSRPRWRFDVTDHTRSW